MYWLYYGQRLGWNHEMSDPNCHMTSLACQRNEHVANPLFRIQTPKQNGREDFATNCQVKCAALGLTWMYHTCEREMSAWPGGLGSLESEEQLQNKRNHQNQKGNEHGSTMFNIFKYFQSTKKNRQMKFTWNPTIHDITLMVWRVLHGVGREPSLENVWTMKETCWEQTR
jgi:hypothetical protein